MKKSRFTESQIVAILKEGEAGVAVARAGAQARDQRGDVLPLEVEVRRGRRARAQAAAGARGREREAQADVRRPGAGEHGDQGRSQPKTADAVGQARGDPDHDRGARSVDRRACQVARLSRAAYYKPGTIGRRGMREVIAALQAIVAEEHRWGFWKCYDRMRAQGLWRGITNGCMARVLRGCDSICRGGRNGGCRNGYDNLCWWNRG